MLAVADLRPVALMAADDETFFPDLCRVALCGSSCPAVVRPGFSRSWGILAVDDMYSSLTPDTLEVAIRPSSAEGCILAEIVDGARLSLKVQIHTPPWLSNFEIDLRCAISGRIVLPLTVGPISVATTLPRPLPVAAWSREIALSLGRLTCELPTLRVFEAQGAYSTIASATWDPGVLLAAYIAHAWTNRSLFRRQHEYCSAPVRCVELGSGVGIAGLALAAAAPCTRVALTDGAPAAVELAKRNVRENGLGTSAVASELAWGSDIADVCSMIGGPPNLVLAADVIYRHETFAPLVRSLAALCDAGRGDAGSDGDAEPAEALLSYRPRVDDAHFWHLLLEEFSVAAVMAPQALGRSGPLEPGVCELASATGECGTDTGGGAAPSSTQQTRIYRLHRRAKRVPTTCRVCSLRNAVRAVAKSRRVIETLTVACATTSHRQLPTQQPTATLPAVVQAIE